MENTSKHYLYHKVPDNLKTSEGNRKIIYPLNMLKEKFPEAYELSMDKYRDDEKRMTVPDQPIPVLRDASWGDVVQLSAIHPSELKKTLEEAGLERRSFQFYQIDPHTLDPEKTTVYQFREGTAKDSTESFSEFHPESLEKHSVIPEITKAYFKEKASKGERPFLFVGVPHIFHKGPIDVTDSPVISV